MQMRFDLVKFDNSIDTLALCVINLSEVLFQCALQVMPAKSVINILTRCSMKWVNRISYNSHEIRLQNPGTGTGNKCANSHAALFYADITWVRSPHKVHTIFTCTHIISSNARKGALVRVYVCESFGHSLEVTRVLGARVCDRVYCRTKLCRDALNHSQRQQKHRVTALWEFSFEKYIRIVIFP